MWCSKWLCWHVYWQSWHRYSHTYCPQITEQPSDYWLRGKRCVYNLWLRELGLTWEVFSYPVLLFVHLCHCVVKFFILGAGWLQPLCVCTHTKNMFLSSSPSQPSEGNSRHLLLAFLEWENEKVCVWIQRGRWVLLWSAVRSSWRLSSHTPTHTIHQVSPSTHTHTHTHTHTDLEVLPDVRLQHCLQPLHGVLHWQRAKVVH